MFTLILVSPVARNFNWTSIRDTVYERLPDHESIVIRIRDNDIPFNYTIKTNSKGIEMIAASTVLYGVKSRFIYDCKKQIAFIDFPQKNIRAWIIKNGNIVPRPIIKDKPYNSSLEQGFSKLAALHLENYLTVFEEELSLSLHNNA